MKKFLFMMFFGLLSISSTFAQDLEIFMWQCQNPGVYYESHMLIFSKGKFTYGVGNLIYQKNNQTNGTYQVVGNNLMLTSDGQTNSFLLTWIHKNKFVLSDQNGNGGMIFVTIGTPEDQFLVNYMNGIYSTGPISIGSGGNGGYRPTTTTPSNQPCWPCTGTGKCNCCSGKGVQGYPAKTCTYCGGSGVCKHCNGTGKFVQR